MKPIIQNNRRAPWLLGFLVLWLSGCGSLPFHFPTFRFPTKATISTPQATITQRGAVAVPAKVSTSTSKASLPVPAGSVVNVHAARAEGAPKAQDPVSVTLAGPSVLSVESTSQGVSGPESFAPPAPPSPAALARGEGVRWFYIAGAVSGLLALLAFYMGQPLNGGVLLAGAVGLPAVGNFLASEWALRLGIAVACVSLAFVVAWLKLRQYHPEYIAAIKAKAAKLGNGTA